MRGALAGILTLATRAPTHAFPSFPIYDLSLVYPLFFGDPFTMV